jgi:hypothetical protein
MKKSTHHQRREENIDEGIEIQRIEEEDKESLQS